MNSTNSIASFDFLKRYIDISYPVCVVGDFNLPSINWQNMSSTDMMGNNLINLVLELGLSQYVGHPTRNNNILDLVLSNDENTVGDVEVHETFSTSDHNYITFNLAFNCVREPKVFFPCYGRADWELIRAHLAVIDWDVVFSDCLSDCEAAWLKFKSIIHGIVSEYVPFRPGSVPKINAPWFNNHLKRMTRKKQRLWKKYKRSQCDTHLREYRQFCKTLHSSVNSARGSYEKYKFQNKGIKPKEFFNYIDSRTKSQRGIPSLKSGSCEYLVDSDKAEALSDHYSQAFTLDNGLLPLATAKMPPNSFCDVIISDEYIIDAINKLNISGAPGKDEISPIFIKNIFPFLIKPLKFIFKCSLSCGILPSDWKIGIICPSYKCNGKPHACGSYRPICLTCIVCKILEHIIRKQTIEYLLSNLLLTEHQHGFLSKCSTTTNLLDCLNNWTKFIDAKNSVDVIYIDFAMAFDTVSFDKLVFKLKFLGIGGNLLSWLEIFLRGRTQ